VSIPLDPPNSPDAEASVVGQMLARPSVVGEVIGTTLQPQHFYSPALRALFHEIVAAYYADDPIDAW
jgi:replicative DNA helicase